ncbi:hypothetical protein EGR_11149 [Echinococcus granulosus]|uniref:Uncharacterized protein n=1 Tax=Echinococcus granulosus TaxID=6210 RepID=W6TZ41_ECHGR|nr:hypothetical protein EGR_11149 [Echinococcus granulosus]EUB53993.1 hypothetical protein EGR_11149 [Echinococcus granulosus]
MEVDTEPIAAERNSSRRTPAQTQSDLLENEVNGELVGHNTRKADTGVTPSSVAKL